ncbi:MAG TPA: hypothetical protein ENH55_02910 [Aurantimonas coralicida]|uniref:Uncharacterized protein n=2 Tax=root TaxID=1 RepID=A0A9C9TFS9_9HYPH|nr:hypothetical protein [Aurantimonas coralicida]HET98982.1 hypothetical protein [Aurantimonas coralicida]
MGEGKDNVASLMGTKRLADAVRQAKIAAAQRADVVVDIREADRARLEILAEELQSLIDELPPGDELFDFTISGGMHPRLWIDGTANVIMARDRRTYRLVRETRLGRVTLLESTDTRVMAQHVTEYVAERIVERDKAFALSDGLNERVAGDASRQIRNGEDAPLRQPEQRTRSADFVIAATWMMIGIVIGAALLLAIASYQGVSIG